MYYFSWLDKLDKEGQHGSAMQKLQFRWMLESAFLVQHSFVTLHARERDVTTQYYPNHNPNPDLNIKKDAKCGLENANPNT